MQNKSSIGPNGNHQVKINPITTIKVKGFEGFNSSPCEYQPEMLTIKKDLIYKIIPCLQAGLENTQSVLMEHDAVLGRTTTKNKMWAETLEQEIRDMKDCIRQLKELNAGNSTHYP